MVGWQPHDHSDGPLCTTVRAGTLHTRLIRPRAQRVCALLSAWSEAMARYVSTSPSIHRTTASAAPKQRKLARLLPAAVLPSSVRYESSSYTRVNQCSRNALLTPRPCRHIATNFSLSGEPIMPDSFNSVAARRHFRATIGPQGFREATFHATNRRGKKPPDTPCPLRCRTGHSPTRSGSDQARYGSHPILPGPVHPVDAQS